MKLTNKQQIVLISCVSKKLSHPAKAKDLYTSTLFKFNMKYAKQLNPDEIYILSAKYGLLPLNQGIEPYEQTLNNMPVSEVRAWAEHVLKQLKKVCVLEKTEFTFLAGDKYRKYLLPHLPITEIPLEGLPVGKQLQKLKSLIHE